MLAALALIASADAHAQDTAQRDPADLARRLLGYTGEPAIPPPSPAYRLGDTLDFWVTRAGGDRPALITAELAAATPTLYVWVERGLDYDADALTQFASQFSRLVNLLRVRDNALSVRRQVQALADLEGLMTWPLPDVDNDPHLYVLFAADLREARSPFYHPNHSLPAPLVPGGYTNQHETLTVNVSALPGIPLGDPTYLNLLGRAFFWMQAAHANPAQPVWLTEALSWYTLLQIEGTALTSQDIAPFLENPNTPLLRLPGLASAGQEFGAQQLFLRYVRQRYGDGVLADLFTLPGDGLEPLDTALAQRNIIDLATGEPVTARDAFADFVMANLLNGFIGDGRYLHRGVQFAQGQSVAITRLPEDLNADLEGMTVGQFATRYFLITSPEPAAVTIAFEGQPINRRLPLPAGGDANRFYWSGGGPNRETTLTRRFDLSGVQKAVLQFDLWHMLADGWNYVYLQVSDDDGQTWSLLPTATGRQDNPYGVAYGPGYTGISSLEAPRPFPYLGVGLAADGVTLTDILPDGPVAQTDILVGDRIAGYDGRPWPGRPNIIAWLSNYRPGDTVNLYIQRGDTFHDVPVTLAAHPTRVFVPDAVWLRQEADLSAYAGRTIQVRFAYVSQPGVPNAGAAVDNITIPEIGFRDDVEGGVPGWTLNGWQPMTNQTPQQFLVQAASIGQDRASSGVRRLLGPNGGARGIWEFNLAAGQLLLLAISGMNDDTDQPASFDLRLRPAAAES